MYKKVFGIALIAHLVLFAYIGLRSGDNAVEEAASDGLNEADSTAVDRDDILEEVQPEPAVSVSAERTATAG